MNNQRLQGDNPGDGNPAIPSLHNSVRPVEHPKADILASDVSWESLRLFMIAAESKSFRRASEIARCSVNKVRDHIAQIEDKAGSPVVLRSPKGLELTRIGADLLAIVRRMREAEAPVAAVGRRRDGERIENFRFAVTEGLGTFWVTPRLVQLVKDAPTIKIQVVSQMALADVKQNEVDLAIQLVKPDDDELIFARVGSLHLIPYATPDYLATNGTPHKVSDLEHHNLVLQTGDQVELRFTEMFLSTHALANSVRIEVNTSSGHYWAVVNGVGVGLMPSYVSAITNRVVPVDIGFEPRRDIFLVYHRNLLRMRNARKMIGLVKDWFDPVRFPWFAEEFIHPRDFPPALLAQTMSQTLEALHMRI
jgi:DNA-binding transcriptional LysR family regulator